MFRRVLIANRGEIALRIIRACREMGIESVVVYSESDSRAGYLSLADETLCIGPAGTSRPYLDIPTIIAAAEIANVDAIHPGYGFLSENPKFAEVCRECNFTFIGPSPETISLLGDKSQARALAMRVGIPVTPGSKGIIRDEKHALETAHSLGYPVLLKAAAGGGGRGLRPAHDDRELVNAFFSAGSEAKAAFKNGDLYMEKLIERPRHVEIQVLVDKSGNAVHLGERDCSLQRRHQKVIEESPSPAVNDALRKEMGEAALALVKAADYEGAGTVEFLLAPNGKFYFMEVNARIQVEHPVSEAVTGLDLLCSQIRIASGMELGMTQEDVRLRGHAIEFRINAEDPESGFTPSPGRLDRFNPPGGRGVRWDSHVHEGCTIPSIFDSLIGKLIVHDSTRQGAIGIGKRALGEFLVKGIKTTIPLCIEILDNKDFNKGFVDTGFIERNLV